MTAIFAAGTYLIQKTPSFMASIRQISVSFLDPFLGEALEVDHWFKTLIMAIQPTPP